MRTLENGTIVLHDSSACDSCGMGVCRMENGQRHFQPFPVGIHAFAATTLLSSIDNCPWNKATAHIAVANTSAVAEVTQMRVEAFRRFLEVVGLAPLVGYFLQLQQFDGDARAAGIPLYKPSFVQEETPQIQVTEPMPSVDGLLQTGDMEWMSPQFMDWLARLTQQLPLTEILPNCKTGSEGELVTTVADTAGSLLARYKGKEIRIHLSRDQRNFPQVFNIKEGIFILDLTSGIDIPYLNAQLVLQLLIMNGTYFNRGQWTKFLSALGEKVADDFLDTLEQLEPLIKLFLHEDRGTVSTPAEVSLVAQT
jgi:hypothetical protein